MTVFRNAFPIVYTEDLPAALRFYRDLLGFAETYRFPVAGSDPEFVALTLAGGGSQALAAAADGQTGAHGQAMRPCGATHQFELCVYTDDVDRAITSPRRQGVPVLGGTGRPTLGGADGLRRRPRRAPGDDLRIDGVCESRRVDIAVVGLGLIGGSLLRALAGQGHRLLAYDLDPATRATARTAAARAPAGARWQVTGTLRDAVGPSELAVLAVPLPALAGVLDELSRTLYTGIVTDVTSVKGPVRDLVATRLRPPHARTAGFVGGHPMTGRESSGFAAGDADLFTGAAWALCIEPDTSMSEWLQVAALVTSLGARVVPATADEHDRAVALVSHVPHLLASALVAAAAGDPLALTLGAGSFRDGTRVAAAPPDLVASMCGGNVPAARAALDAVLASLTEARAALNAPDPMAALRPWLTGPHALRSAWPPVAASSLDLPAHADTLLRLGRVGGWVTAVAADRRTVSASRPAL